MQTLTADQFKQKYGAVGASQFTIADAKQKQEESLFQSIKNDIANVQNNMVRSNTPGYEGVGGAATGIIHNAAQIGGGLGQVVGDTASRIPVVGGLVKGVGNALQSGFSALTDKIGGTKFMDEAAAGLEQGNNLEKGLSIASDLGTIANTGLMADAGVGGVKSTIDATKSAITRGGEVASNIHAPDLGATGKYIQGAIKDVVPTSQGLIDHSIATALNLTPGDLGRIAQSTGNEVGAWLADNNLIGTNRATTQAMVNNFFETNYKAVRSEIAKVEQVYKPNQVPRFIDTLKAIKSSVDEVPGLEKDSSQITELLKKKELLLEDIQNVKEMLDKHFNLYNSMGDVAQAKVKQGLANMRGELKSFIEDQVKKYTGADIRKMNNDVATARTISDAITTRAPRGITRGMVGWRDLAVGAGLTYFGSPVAGIAAVAAWKLITSPTVRLRFARYLDGLNDAKKLKVSEGFKTGDIPKDALDVIGPLNAQQKIPSQ